MKKIIFMLALIIANFTIEAQVKTPQASPKSSSIQTVGLTEVEIEYSRPAMKGRTVFGNVVPFGKIWRTGANANSTVSFSEDVTIGGKTLKKGKYAIYTTPKVDSWEVSFYTDTDSWGVPDNWSESKIALKTTVKPEMLTRPVESLTIAVNGITNDSAVLEISWVKTLVPLKFEVPTNKAAMASIERTLAGPSSNDYFAAGQYLYQSNGDLKLANEYVNKSLEMNKDKPFWMIRQKALIQAKLGDKKGAIETAKQSMAAAKAAKNDDYVKMNQDSINEWSKG